MKPIFPFLMSIFLASSVSAQEEAGEGELEEDESRIETVLITQEKIAKIGGAAHRVTEEEMKRTDYANPEALVQQVPGVFVRGEDGFGLRPNIGIRGANSDRSKKVALMEDGILFGPAPYSAPAAYYFPQISRMVGVEVFKGPGAVQFGPNTMGGAMNLITRNVPNKFSGAIALEGGQYYTGRAHGWIGSSADWGGFVAEGVHHQSSGFKDLDGGGDSGFDRQEFMLKGHLNSDYSGEHFHKLTTKIGWSREHSNETYLGLSDSDFRANPNRRYRASQLDQMDWVRAQLEARHLWEWGDFFEVETVFYRNDMRREWFKLNRMAEGTPIFDVLNDPSGRRQVLYEILTGETDSLAPGDELFLGNNDRTYTSQGIQSAAKWRSEGEGWANVLEAGVRLHYDNVRRRHTESAHRMENGKLLESGEIELNTRNIGETYALAFHALEQFSAWRVTLTPGARIELFEQRLDDQLTGAEIRAKQVVLVPGIGMNVALVEHLSLLGGVHRGFSPTSPGQSSDVQPETSVNYEAGIRYSDSRRGRLLELIGFYNDYSNLLGECGFSSGCDESQLDSQFNAGEVKVLGLEVAGHWDFEIRKEISLPVRLSYTHVRSEFQTAFSSENPQYGRVEVGDELPYVPAHQASLQVGLRLKKAEAYLTGSYVSEMREEAGAGEGILTDAQMIVDANVKYDLGGGWGLSLRGENLLGDDGIASRRPMGARPARPRLIMGGASYAF